jgi:cell division protease FtsH
MFDEISSGALDDLEKVTKQAYSMVAFLGFDKKIGNVSFYDSSGKYEISMSKPYSEETGRLIDEQVRYIVERSFEQAKDILFKHKNELIQMTDQLLEKETLSKEEIESILGKKSSLHAAVLADTAG